VPGTATASETPPRLSSCRPCAPGAACLGRCAPTITMCVRWLRWRGLCGDSACARLGGGARLGDQRMPARHHGRPALAWHCQADTSCRTPPVPAPGEPGKTQLNCSGEGGDWPTFHSVFGHAMPPPALVGGGAAGASMRCRGTPAYLYIRGPLGGRLRPAPEALHGPSGMNSGPPPGTAQCLFRVGSPHAHRPLRPVGRCGGRGLGAALLCHSADPRAWPRVHAPGSALLCSLSVTLCC